MFGFVDFDLFRFALVLIFLICFCFALISFILVFVLDGFDLL